MSKLFKQIIILICLVAILILPYFVFAGQPETLKKLTEVGTEGGYSSDTNKYTFSQTLGTVVKALLSLLGVIFIILIILAGHNWMTAGGDEEKIRKAKETISRAIIGLIIVVGSYAIWNFIWHNFLTAS